MELRSEPFSVGLVKSPIQSQPPVPTMRLTFASDGTSIYKHVPSSPPPYPGSGAAAPAAPREAPALPLPLYGTPDAAKRKRGRPRKYGPDGGTTPLVQSASPRPAASVQTAPSGLASPVGTPSSGGQLAPSIASDLAGSGVGVVKKARGRPPGSRSQKKLQMSGLGSTGTGFAPHVLTVKAGEDVSSAIMSFLQNGSRALCVLSANGAISNVTLRQAATSGGTVTYEGRFEILSLSGSFLFSETGGQRSRTGGLSVSLAGPDGRVLGGGVAGLLTAASPVQVVVGSFIAERKKEVKDINIPDLGFSTRPLSVSNAGAASPPSRGTLSESSGGQSSPHHQGAGYNNGNQHNIPSMTSWITN